MFALILYCIFFLNNKQTKNKHTKTENTEILKSCSTLHGQPSPQFTDLFDSKQN